MVIALASALGPTLASAILAVASWHWLFAINVPIGLVAIGIAAWALPHTEHPPRRYDSFAAALNALTFGPLVLGAESLVRGGNRILGVATLALGVAAGTTLVRRSLSQTHPLIPIDLLRIRVLALSIGASFTTFIAQTLAYVSLPFMMQYALGRSAVETGFLMTPWPLAVALVAPLAGRIADRPIGKAMGPAALVVFAIGLILLGLLPAHAGVVDISWRMAVCGVGFALFQSPNNRAIMGSPPRHRVGSAGGLLATARLSGQTVGATLVAFLFHLQPGPRGAVLPLFIGGAIAMAAAGVSAFKLRTYDPGAGDPNPEEGL
jgi:DHA2 family multidrug resistance protein-like MFS transporter